MAASSAAIQAGRAFVELFADDRKLRAGLGRAGAAVMGFGKNAAKLGKDLFMAGAALLGPFALATRFFLKNAETLGDAADQDSARRFMESFNELRVAASMAFFEIGAAIAEALGPYLKHLTQGALALARFIDRNKQLVAGVALFGAALMAAGVALIVFGKIAMGVGAMLLALKLALAAATWLTNPWILLGVVLAGVAVAITAANIEWQALGQRWGETWDGIVAALGKGDLQTAFQLITKSLELEWALMISFFTRKWREFKNYIAEKAPGRETISEVGAQVVGALAWPFGQREAVLEDFRNQNAELGNPTGIRPRPVDEDPDVIAARARVAALQAERDKLIAKAKEPADAPRRLSYAVEQLALASKGLFSSSALSQSLALHDKPMNRIADNTKATAENTKKIADNLRGGGIIE